MKLYDICNKYNCYKCDLFNKCKRYQVLKIDRDTILKTYSAPVKLPEIDNDSSNL